MQLETFIKICPYYLQIEGELNKYFPLENEKTFANRLSYIKIGNIIRISEQGHHSEYIILDIMKKHLLLLDVRYELLTVVPFWDTLLWADVSVVSENNDTETYWGRVWGALKPEDYSNYHILHTKNPQMYGGKLQYNWFAHKKCNSSGCTIVGDRVIYCEEHGRDLYSLCRMEQMPFDTGRYDYYYQNDAGYGHLFDTVKMFDKGSRSFGLEFG